MRWLRAVALIVVVFGPLVVCLRWGAPMELAGFASGVVFMILVLRWQDAADRDCLR